MKTILRMIFGRRVRLADGVWLVTPRDMPDREVRRLVANFIYRRGTR